MPQSPSPSSLEQVRQALQAARQFIRNGVELGYIRMPDADCPDTAHETPALIDAALSAVEALGQQEAGSGWQWVPKEPTDAMLAAIRQRPHPNRPDGWDQHHAGLYRAMLACAPSPTEPKAAEGVKEGGRG